jgi:dihydroxyacetone kinase-like predicted kinase
MAAKRALRNLYADLVQGIGADGTLHHYFSNNLITNGEKETIESERTITKRNTKLVDALMRRDEDKAIKGIIKVLELEKEANENLLRKIEEEYPEYSYDEQPKSESTDNPDHDSKTSSLQ